jgi:lipopolysaccharide export LptBFGC system permease protein LptF
MQVFKMTFTLHRYIFRELARIFILTTFGLTLILSLGLILEPIQKFGVGPRQVIHLLGLFLPVTLTFVLPIAALFAATLAYGRLAGDNELDACKASGISPMTIVYPGFVLAILVAMANLVLSFHVMPYFIRKAETAIKADAKQILNRNIQRQGFYAPRDGDFAVFADRADPQKDTLSGVVVVQSNKQGRIERIIASDLATVSFDMSGRENKVRIAAFQTILMEDERSSENYRFIMEESFEALLKDNVDFKRINEIKEIQADLLSFRPIEELARQTYAQFVTELIHSDILASLASDQGFYELKGEPNSVRISAGQCILGPEKTIEFQDEVKIVRFNARGQDPDYQCTRAVLKVEGDEFKPTLSLEIHNASPMEAPGVTMYSVVDGLKLPRGLRPEMAEGDVLSHTNVEAISSALQAGPSPILAGFINRLDRKKYKTFVKIKGIIHSRLVFGIGCIPMILIGIGLGIVQRGGHLLSAFAASCIPSVILTVGIISGKHVAENPDSTVTMGLSIMWIGLGFLGLLALIIFRRLYRN